MIDNASASPTTQPSAAPDNARVVQLLRQARQQIETLEARLASAAPPRTPLAIVGMACRVPDGESQSADTLAAFWTNLRNGHDAIHPLPAQRAALYPTPPTTQQPGGYLAGIDRFDAPFFGISGREAPTIDPQQRLLLELAWEALEEAAIDPTTLAGSRTGVFIGISSNDYAHLQQAKGIPVNAYAGVGNALSIAANRISYLFDLRGPSLAIDTACSSSLVALHHACQSLRRGECDGALVGGVNLILTATVTDAFRQAGMLAADGRCKTFDARADGYVRSEGAGMVYLKRLPDAQQDNDHIWAVLMGSAVNQDGRSNGLTAPNGPAQQAVIRAAFEDAGVTPTQIGYVETHGTGTELGDPIEVNALKAILCGERSADQPCWLGAVKANIGHLEAAAGVIGLIKTALCLHHGMIPPQLHLQTHNPYMALADTPLAIPTQPMPWPPGAGPRYAGVSSFGFGGTNAHVVLTEAPAPRGEPRQHERPHQLFTLAAKSEAALRALAQAHAEHLAESLTECFADQPPLSLADLCYTVNTGRTHFAHRLAIVATDLCRLQEQLARFGAGQTAPETVTGHGTRQTLPAVAFLFTGQGAQWVGMGEQLYASEPHFRATIDQCDTRLRPFLDCSLVDLLYPHETDTHAGGHSLHQTRYTQPVLFAVEYALAQTWLAWGIKPTYVMGHSIGELVAACVAGALSLDEGLRLAAIRGELMQALPAAGAMVAVFCDEATIHTALRDVAGRVAVAAVNGRAHTVISGEQSALNGLIANLAAAGIDHQPLTVSHAFHSPLMEPMLDAFTAAVAEISFQPLQIELVSTVSGDLLPKGHRFDAHYWRQQVREPVHFTAAIDTLLDQGCRHFMEIGPKPVLTNLGRDYADDVAAAWLPSLIPHQPAWATMLSTVAHFYTQGLSIDWPALHGDAHGCRLSLPTYRFQRKSYWLPEERNPMQTNGIHSTDAPFLPAAVAPQQATARQTDTLPLTEAAVLDDLCTLFADTLHVAADEIAAHSSFLDLGADSIVLAEAVRHLERRFGITLPIRRFFTDLTTPAALAAHIAAEASGSMEEILLEKTVLEKTVLEKRPEETAGAEETAEAKEKVIGREETEAKGKGNTEGAEEMWQSTTGHLLPAVNGAPTTIQQLLTILDKQLDLLARYDLTLDLPVRQAALDREQPTVPPIPPHTAAPQHHPRQTGTPAPVAEQPAAPIPPTEPKTIPLTAAQQQLWFLSQFNADASVAYNESVTLRLHGPLETPALRSAIQTLVDRHEALRTIIGREGDVQQILPTLPATLTIIDFTDQHGAAREDGVAAWLDAESRRPIDLSSGPLFRTYLLELRTNAESLLVLTAHHIIIDGLSLARLLHELAILYSAHCRRVAPALAPAPQFSDYVKWQSTQLQTGAWRNQEAYWLQQLQGALPVLDLPLDHPRPPRQGYHGALATVTFDAELTAALKRFSSRQGCTLFMTLFTAYTLWLHRLSGQDEVIVGIPVAGRGMAGAEALVGYCTHLLPIRHTLAGKPTFVAMLAAMRTQLLTAYDHQDYPFAHLINQRNVERDLSLAPIVNSTFNLTRQPAMPDFAGVTAGIGPRPTSFVDHDWGVNILESEGTLTADFEYNRDLFDAETATRLAGHFTTLVRAIVANPLQTVTTLPLLNARERQQLLVDWNITDFPFNEQQRFHQLFAAQVARTPDAVSVCFQGEQLTYQALNEIAEAMAQQLRSVGVGDETVVALLCDRSPAFLAAVIAIFKAGGAYLPLDVRAPAARQSQVLAQSRTPLLLITQDYCAAAEEALAALPTDQRPQLLSVAENCELQMLDCELRTAQHSGTHRARNTQQESRITQSPLAYVIYTSGSTGLPKGAMVEQRGMINHLYAKIKDLDLTAADTVAQTAPQSFDISVWQFLAPLVVGGRVHIFPDEIAADPVALLQATAAHEITVLEVVPSLLRMMVEALEQGPVVNLTRLRWMIPTGEALPPNLARQWLCRCPTIPLVNAYGPTECADDVTHYVVTEPPDEAVVNMPIGRPIINMRLYILDAERQPVPIGVAGELYVGGIGVGRGYIHDEERTAQAFVPDPFSADPQVRLYKTGDKARYLPDGNIEYLGRLDYQVKIRGFRIELGEIEAVLETHPDVRQAIVMDQPDPTGNRRLIAYVVATLDASLSTLHSSLRNFLGETLPDYMVPAAFVLLDAMPLTPNGKVDRKALPVPDTALWSAGDAYVAPETALQTQLVALWGAVLKLDPDAIGIEHNFFALGGHSLLAVQIIARVRNQWGVELPIRTLLEQPTVAGMAAALQTQLHGDGLLPSVVDPTLSLPSATTEPTREVIEL